MSTSYSTVSPDGEILGLHIRLPRERERCAFFCVGDSRTVQSAADSCDVNKIIQRYDRTGILPDSGRGPGQYGDVTGLQGDLTEAINLSRDAQSKVDAVRADRAAKAAAERDELIALGVAAKAAASAPAPAPDGGSAA